MSISERGHQRLIQLKQQAHLPTNNINEIPHEFLQTVILKTLVGAHVGRKTNLLLEQTKQERLTREHTTTEDVSSERVNQPTERELHISQTDGVKLQRALKQHETVLRRVCLRWNEIVPVMLFQYRIKKYTTEVVHDADKQKL